MKIAETNIGDLIELGYVAHQETKASIGIVVNTKKTISSDGSVYTDATWILMSNGFVYKNNIPHGTYCEIISSLTK